MRASPALVALGMLGAGFVSARAFPGGHSTLWLGLACVLLIVALIGRGWVTRVALCAAVFLGGFGWFTLRIHERPRDSLALLIDRDPLAEPGPSRIGGMVIDSPRQIGGEGVADRWPLPPRPRQIAFDLRVRGVGAGSGAAGASGVVRVRIDEPLSRAPAWLRAGAWVDLTGTLRPIGAPLNPCEPPRNLLAAQEDLAGAVFVPSLELVELSEARSTVQRVRATRARLLAGLRGLVEETLSGEDAGSSRDKHSHGRALLRAMLLGERDPALREVESAFRRIGLVHVIAISGFNLAVLAWVALLAIRLTGDRGWLEPAIGAAAVALYMLILPGEASIQRAGWTVLVFTISEALGRRYDRMALLAWTAFVLLLVRPMDLWSLGFQLSFGIVGTLLWLGERVHERLWGMTIRGLVPTPRQRAWWWMTGSLVGRGIQAQISATLLAWAAASPLIALHTGMFSPLAPAASMVVLPITVVIMLMGYAAILLGLVVPPLAGGAGELLAHLGDAAVWLVTRIDEWPGATVHLPRLSAAWAVLATACVIYWLGWGWLRDWRAWVLTTAAAAWLAVLCTVGSRLPDETRVRLDALSVGDGSCTLVRSGDAAMLVDCGVSGSRPGPEDVARAVRELGAWRVPTVLITEPRVQSWSLLPELIEPLGVKTVLIAAALEDAAMVEPTGSASRLVTVLRERGLTIRVLDEGDRFALGERGVVVTMTGDAERASSEGARVLVPRVRTETAGGARSAIIAGSARYPFLDALSGRERHADVLIAPRAMRASDRPADLARALGSEVLIHSGGAATGRELLLRLGPRDVLALVTARGAARAEITADGAVRSGQHGFAGGDDSARP